MNKDLLIYKIQFSKSSKKLQYDYEKLSDDDKNNISIIEVVAYFDYNESDKYTIFVIVNKNEIEKYIDLLNKNKIKFVCEDISKDVLNGDINVDMIIKSHVNKKNIINYKLFMDCLNEWLYNNYDVDMILDKISKHGIESLNKIELEFLNDYSNKLKQGF